MNMYVIEREGERDGAIKIFKNNAEKKNKREWDIKKHFYAHSCHDHENDNEKTEWVREREKWTS